MGRSSLKKERQVSKSIETAETTNPIILDTIAANY
jgi:hypothetical protein